MRKVIFASEIQEGMKIWVHGYLMEARDITHLTYIRGLHIGKTGTYFKGHCVNKNDDIYHTCYNGGTYGSIDTYEWTIEVDG